MFVLNLNTRKTQVLKTKRKYIIVDKKNKTKKTGAIKAIKGNKDCTCVKLQVHGDAYFNYSKVLWVLDVSVRGLY